MKKKSTVSELKKDLIHLTKKEGWKILSVYTIFVILLVLIGMLTLSTIFSELGFFHQYEEEVLNFKTSYQGSGAISSDQGSMLLEIGGEFTKAKVNTVLLLLMFSLFYGFLRGIKTKIIQKIIFKKKLPKKYLAQASITNSLFMVVMLFVVLFTFLKIRNPVGVLMIWFFSLLILESLVYLKENKYLTSKKTDLLKLYLKQLLANLIITLLIYVGLIILLTILNLVGGIIGVILVFIILLLTFIKRELILYLMIKYLGEESR